MFYENHTKYTIKFHYLQMKTFYFTNEIPMDK